MSRIPAEIRVCAVQDGGVCFVILLGVGSNRGVFCNSVRGRKQDSLGQNIRSEPFIHVADHGSYVGFRMWMS